MNSLHAKPKSRPGGRSERVAESVKQATIAILLTEGATALTLEAVAARADVNRTTIYRRWGDRNRLIAWALLETVGEEVPYVEKGSLEADLLFVMKGVNEFLDTRLAKSMMQFMSDESNAASDGNQAIREFWDSRLRRMAEVFDRAVNRKEISAHLDTDYVVDQLFGPVYLNHIVGRGKVTQKYLQKLVTDVLSRIG